MQSMDVAARTPVDNLVGRVERGSRLDGAVNMLRHIVMKVFPPGPRADAWHGRWLGHPLHPTLTDVPIGAWTSAAVLDAVGGQERAATTLVGVGLAAAVPTAISGATDWSEAATQQQRLGLLHAAANGTAAALYAGSLVARLTGRARAGRVLGWLGLACVGAGGYLGGHLAYRSGTGVNQAAPDRHRLPADWADLGRLDAFPDRRLSRRMIGDVPVLVYRDGGDVRVLLDHCGHMSGPLADGQLVADSPDGARAGVGDACVVCPWHGSTFRLRDGAVLRGPATSPQPVLQTRLLGGRVQARRG